MVTSRVSNMTDTFVYGTWSTMISTHRKISQTTPLRKGSVEPGRLKKSKVPQVCAPFPSETETLKEQVSKGTGSVLLALCSSTCATKKVTQNPLASIFFFEIQALKMCPAHNEYFVWIPSFDPLSNVLIYTLLLSSFSR